MSRDFRQLIELQISKAQSERKLDELTGQGAPLPDRSNEAMIEISDLVMRYNMARDARKAFLR